MSYAPLPESSTATGTEYSYVPASASSSSSAPQVPQYEPTEYSYAAPSSGGRSGSGNGQPKLAITAALWTLTFLMVILALGLPKWVHAEMSVLVTPTDKFEYSYDLGLFRACFQSNIGGTEHSSCAQFSLTDEVCNHKGDNGQPTTDCNVIRGMRAFSVFAILFLFTMICAAVATLLVPARRVLAAKVAFATSLLTVLSVLIVSALGVQFYKDTLIASNATTQPDIHFSHGASFGLSWFGWVLSIALAARSWFDLKATM